MRRIRNFARLPTHEKALLLKATALLFCVRALFWIFPYRMVKPLFAWTCRHRQHRCKASPGTLAWAVAVAGTLVPGGAHCLSQATSLQILLSRRGFESHIRFGIRRPGGAPLMAHAWLEYRGDVLIGGENLDRFVHLASPANSANSAMTAGSTADPLKQQ